MLAAIERGASNTLSSCDHLKHLAPEELSTLLREIARGCWEELEPIVSRTWDVTTLDSLTGVYQRGIFSKMLRKVVLPRMYRMAKAKDLVGKPKYGSIVYIDMDRFKDVNTDFGHAGGDELLRVFGPMLNEHFRSDDIIGRMGGDEFMIVAAGLDHKEVSRRMTALEKEFEAYPWNLAPLDPETPPRAFTFSFDVVEIQDPADIESLINQADANVLQQKQDRDRRVEAERAQRYP